MSKVLNSIKGEQALELIKELGGVNATARICKIASSSVSSWSRIGVPRARLMFLQVKFPKLKFWDSCDIKEG